MTYPPLLPSTRPTIDRAYDVLYAWRRAEKVNPIALFQPKARWRLSPDVGLAARVEAEPYAERVPGLTPGDDRLFGWPIDVDDSLPKNSMLLETVR